jgi:hypothetical protein
VAIVAALIAWVLLRRRGPATSEAAGIALPGRITPLSTIAALQRVDRRLATLSPDQRQTLAGDIEALQFACFGPNGHTRPDEAAMRALLERWLTPG